MTKQCLFILSFSLLLCNLAHGTVLRCEAYDQLASPKLFDLVLPDEYTDQFVSLRLGSNEVQYLTYSVDQMGVGSIHFGLQSPVFKFAITRRPRKDFSLMGFYIRADTPITVHVRTDLTPMTFRYLDPWNDPSKGYAGDQN